MSSRVIPGNGRAVSNLINEMYHQGAEVLYESVRAIHASGHAQQSELKAMIKAVRPEYFVPVHGEYRHLIKHGRLAEECGVEKDNVIILEDGCPLSLTWDGTQRLPPIPVECTLVDGKGVGDVGAAVLKERRILGDEGMVIVVLVVDSDTGYILHGPDIVSKGFVFEQYYANVFDEAKCLVLDEIESASHQYNIAALQEDIHTTLRHFFRRVLDRDPVVVPIITEV